PRARRVHLCRNRRDAGHCAQRPCAEAVAGQGGAEEDAGADIMTDLDLERLGTMWRQSPDPAEMENLRRSAAQVRKRARAAQRVDAIAALLVSLVILFLVLSNPKIDTLAVGGGALLILLTSQIRSRRLRKAELEALTGTTEEML